MRRSAAAAGHVSPALLSELAAMHLSEPARWTGPAIALRARLDDERLGAAVVTLARLQAKRAEGGDEEDGSRALRKRVADAWGELKDGGGGGGGRRRPERGAVVDVVAEAQGREKEAGRVLVDDIYEALRGEGEIVEEEDEEVADEEVRVSEMQAWVDELVSDDAGKEVKRKTSYAFIEAGVKNEAPRAVWIRDGPSGKLRKPSEEEEAHLLGQRSSMSHSSRRAP